MLARPAPIPGDAVELPVADPTLAVCQQPVSTLTSHELTGRWAVLPVARDPMLLHAVQLQDAHDFRHTYATWLEDAGTPARVIDELTELR